MAVIVSSSDANTSLPINPSSNDTNWMQDLVVETKPEIVEQKNDTPVVTITPVKEIQKSEVIVQKSEPIIKNMYIEADQAVTAKIVEPLVQVAPTIFPEIKPINSKAVDLDELFGTVKPNISIEKITEEKMPSTQTPIQKEKNDHHTLQKFMFALAGSLAVIAG